MVPGHCVYGWVIWELVLTRSERPGAGREWCWQHVFPSEVRSVDPRSKTEHGTT
jgi:hypothetical protein